MLSDLEAVGRVIGVCDRTFDRSYELVEDARGGWRSLWAWTLGEGSED